MTKTKHKNPLDEHKVGSLTSAQDWAGSLISGQTTTGRILVSCKLGLNSCVNLLVDSKPKICFLRSVVR